MGDTPIEDVIKEITRIAIPSQNLASGPLSFTSSIGNDFKLISIRLKATAPITQTLSWSSISDGTLEVLEEQASSANNTNFVFYPHHEILFKNGDEIKVQCTNTGTPAASISGFLEVEKV